MARLYKWKSFIFCLLFSRQKAAELASAPFVASQRVNWVPTTTVLGTASGTTDKFRSTANRTWLFYQKQSTGRFDRKYIIVLFFVQLLYCLLVVAYADTYAMESKRTANTRNVHTRYVSKYVCCQLKDLFVSMIRRFR